MRCLFYPRCGVPTSVTCNETGGDYYELGRKAGCYRSLEAAIEVNRRHRRVELVYQFTQDKVISK